MPTCLGFGGTDTTLSNNNSLIDILALSYSKALQEACVSLDENHLHVGSINELHCFHVVYYSKDEPVLYYFQATNFPLSWILPGMRKLYDKSLQRNLKLVLKKVGGVDRRCCYRKLKWNQNFRVVVCSSKKNFGRNLPDIWNIKMLKTENTVWGVLLIIMYLA